MKKLLLLMLLTNSLLAQTPEKSKLRIENDGNWIEYAVPEFMKNITPEDNQSPHFFRYDFESADQNVNIYILVNNSTKYRFNLKKSFEGELSRKDLKITYKNLKEDKYFISGNLNNGRILYQFCKAKDGYGYTYSMEYEKSYSEFFNNNIEEIIKKFKILF